MRYYILECSHPHVRDTDYDQDEQYLEIVYEKESHEIPAQNSTEALTQVEIHAKTQVRYMGKTAHPRPKRLIRVIKEWPET